MNIHEIDAASTAPSLVLPGRRVDVAAAPGSGHSRPGGGHRFSMMVPLDGMDREILKCEECGHYVEHQFIEEESNFRCMSCDTRSNW